MQLIITLTEKERVEFTVKPSSEDEKVTYDTLLAVMLSVIQSSTETLLKTNHTTSDDKETLAIQIEDQFMKCFYRIFPEYIPNEDSIELSDAAIIKAQDDIINDAHERGISYAQAMKEWNTKANEYVAEKRAQELMRNVRPMS